MKKYISSLLAVLILTFCLPASAENFDVAENMQTVSSPLTSDKFTIFIDVLPQKGVLLESSLKFDLKSMEDTLVSSGEVLIANTEQVKIEFSVPEYEIGTKFKLTMTEGAQSILFYTDTFYAGQPFIAETYAYRDTDENLIISNGIHLSIVPNIEPWDITAEKFAESHNFDSKTDYLVWVSKKNFTVFVFLKRDYGWDCIRQIPCSIGAPKTPTVTGEFTYHQYQNKWFYDKYYVGPVMRFYGGYAIHSTLVNYDGTDHDARLGKKISLGCVRVLPKEARWLTDYVPLGTKIYVTED